MRRFSLFITLLWGASLTHAQTIAYISDQFEIALRTGPGKNFPVIQMLPSGTELRVLENHNAAGYARVRINNGAEGWVVNRYLTKEPAARIRLIEMGKRIAELEEKNRHLILNDEQTRSKLLQNAKALENENKLLNHQIVTLKRELEVLRKQYTTLQDTTRRDWFLIGAGVILIGILIGLVIPRMRWHRRSSWSSF